MNSKNIKINKKFIIEMSIVEAAMIKLKEEDMWWLNESIDQSLKLGEERGWLNRLSTTNVQWTNTGLNFQFECKKTDLQYQLENEADLYGQTKSHGFGKPGFFGVISSLTEDISQPIQEMNRVSKEEGRSFFVVLVDGARDCPFKVIKALEGHGTETIGQWAKTPKEAYDTLPGANEVEVEYDLASVIAAMEKTREMNAAWWMNPGIDQPLRFGAKQNWVFRLSTTQAGWTDAGFKLVKEYKQEQLQKKLEREAMEFGPNRDGFYGVISEKNFPDDFMPQDDKIIDAGMKEMARCTGIQSFAIQVDASKDSPFRVIKTLEEPGTEIGSQWAKTPKQAYDMLPCIEVTHDVDNDSHSSFPS